MTTNYTLSELGTVSFWPNIPDQPGNRVGICRLSVPEPRHIGKESFLPEDSRKLLIKALMAKKREIQLKRKTLRVPLVMLILSMLATNIMPNFLLNFFIKSRRLVTYAISNGNSLPVTIEFMGLPVDRIIVVPAFVPEMFGNYSLMYRLLTYTLFY